MDSEIITLVFQLRGETVTMNVPRALIEGMFDPITHKLQPGPFDLRGARVNCSVIKTGQFEIPIQIEATQLPVPPAYDASGMKISSWDSARQQPKYEYRNEPPRRDAISRIPLPGEVQSQPPISEYQDALTYYKNVIRSWSQASEEGQPQAFNARRETSNDPYGIQSGRSAVPNGSAAYRYTPAPTAHVDAVGYPFNMVYDPSGMALSAATRPSESKLGAAENFATTFVYETKPNQTSRLCEIEHSRFPGIYDPMGSVYGSRSPKDVD